MKTSTPEPGSAAKTFLLAGVVAGTADILAAFVTNAPRGVSPLQVLRSVASGLLGGAAFQGGAATAALGLVLHFVIATAVAAVFYLASRRLRWLVERPLWSGPAYGIAVYGVMSYVIVPLSAAPFAIGRSPANVLVGLAVHMLCVGLPVALVVARSPVR